MTNDGEIVDCLCKGRIPECLKCDGKGYYNKYDLLKVDQNNKDFLAKLRSENNSKNNDKETKNRKLSESQVKLLLLAEKLRNLPLKEIRKQHKHLLRKQKKTGLTKIEEFKFKILSLKIRKNNKSVKIGKRLKKMRKRKNK